MVGLPPRTARPPPVVIHTRTSRLRLGLPAPDVPIRRPPAPVVSSSTRGRTAPRGGRVQTRPRAPLHVEAAPVSEPAPGNLRISNEESGQVEARVITIPPSAEAEAPATKAAAVPEAVAESPPPPAAIAPNVATPSARPPVDATERGNAAQEQALDQSARIPNVQRIEASPQQMLTETSTLHSPDFKVLYEAGSSAATEERQRVVNSFSYGQLIASKTSSEDFFLCESDETREENKGKTLYTTTMTSIQEIGFDGNEPEAKATTNVMIVMDEYGKDEDRSGELRGPAESTKTEEHSTRNEEGIKLIYMRTVNEDSEASPPAPSALLRSQDAHTNDKKEMDKPKSEKKKKTNKDNKKKDKKESRESRSTSDKSGDKSGDEERRENGNQEKKKNKPRNAVIPGRHISISYMGYFLRSLFFAIGSIAANSSPSPIFTHVKLDGFCPESVDKRLKRRAFYNNLTGILRLTIEPWNSPLEVVLDTKTFHSLPCVMCRDNKVPTLPGAVRASREEQAEIARTFCVDLASVVGCDSCIQSIRMYESYYNFFNITLPTKDQKEAPEAKRLLVEIERAVIKTNKETTTSISLRNATKKNIKITIGTVTLHQLATEDRELKKMDIREKMIGPGCEFILEVKRVGKGTEFVSVTASNGRGTQEETLCFL